MTPTGSARDQAVDCLLSIPRGRQGRPDARGGRGARAARAGAHRTPPPAPLSAQIQAAQRARHARDGAIFVVAAYTGLRLGELRALRWRDVDFAKRLIRVRRSYSLGVVCV